MRVLLVAHHLPPRHVAGTEVYTARLGAALARRHEVLAFATDDDPLLRRGEVRRRRSDGVDVVEFAEPRVASSPDTTWTSPLAEAAFARLLDEFAPDVCHFQHLRFLGMGLPALARARGVATLMTLHDYWLLCARDGQLVDQEGALCPGPSAERCAACLATFRFGLSPAEHRVARAVAALKRRLGVDLRGVARKAGLAWRGMRRNSMRGRSLPHDGAAGMLRIVEARRAAALAIPPAIDVFIAPSEFLRGVFRDAGWGGGRWVTVGHGVDRPETARPAVRSGGSEPLRIGFAGTVTPLKGVDVLIHAVAMLEPGACTVEVRGSTELRPEYAAALKREARSLPIAFHGAHAPGEAQRFVQQWDVCVVPSRWVENQPLVILEAFAAGVPVVASDLGGMRELVHEGRNGRLFESGNAAALAAVLRELAADRGALAALRAGVTPPPSMETHVARIESLYAEARAAHAS